ncbi:WD_0736 family protein [Wolbachia endosymbiont (group A) of Hylaeus communis]|uniref:WD_0736 family protein n=1 Tax=Wolbachia endosymbiont (group A) of Hylaeus communis TaxID=2954018 RepID=UPI00222EBB01|nr:hypothetical protein [Wolbachia endosymbiont (group A) of Hylaeus communis]
MKTNIDEPCAGNLQARFFRGSCSNKTQTRGVKLQLLPNVNNKEKHQIAFCVSAVTFLAGLSLIATAIAVGTVPAIAACLVIGGILTVLSGVQAVESYLFLRNSEKTLNKLISNIRDEPESKLFIERILQTFIELFSELKQHN